MTPGSLLTDIRRGIAGRRMGNLSDIRPLSYGRRVNASRAGITTRNAGTWPRAWVK
jgi:hypothetical protein